jgi:signal transduction histidine kinase
LEEETGTRKDSGPKAGTLMPTAKTDHILIIDSVEKTDLCVGLRSYGGFQVSYLPFEQATIAAVQQLNADLIILNVNSTPSKAAALLSSLAGAQITTPVLFLGAFSGNDEGSLSLLAAWAAMAIQNARLYADTKQLSRDLRLVNEISQLVSSTLDPQQIPRLLLQRTAEIVEAECGSLALIDKEQEAVVFQLAYDSQGQELKGLTNFLMPLGKGIVGLVAQTGQPIITNDVKNHPAWSPLPDQLTGFTTEKLIAVPLTVEGEILGVMELLNKKNGDFVQDDLQLLSLVASSAAIAIQNARQYAALERANQALQEAQEQRIAAERWAILGRAAAGLAHRINNSTALVPIASQHIAELLAQVKMPAEVREKIDRNLDRINRNSLYTVELAAALLRRFRHKPTQAYNINQLVEQALALFDLPPNVKVIRHLDSELPAIDTNDLLVDVFVELIGNSIRALAGRGGLIRIATFKSGPDHVSIQVTDNGPGIPAEQINRIFDIFYTTNPNGLGFGLWWVKTFLEQQGGEIVVESQLNDGSTFTIILPRTLPPLHSLEK